MAPLSNTVTTSPSASWSTIAGITVLFGLGRPVLPAIVDHDADGEVVTVFESGAILLHLAGESSHFMPTDRRGRGGTLEWLFWQVGMFGPMAGQLSHFVNYAQGGRPYSHQRYANET